MYCTHGMPACTSYAYLVTSVCYSCSLWVFMLRMRLSLGLLPAPDLRLGINYFLIPSCFLFCLVLPLQC